MNRGVGSIRGVWSGPLTPSLSPSEGERVPDMSAVALAKAEGRERGRFMENPTGFPTAQWDDEPTPNPSQEGN